jgi:hypothetical protein
MMIFNLGDKVKCVDNTSSEVGATGSWSLTLNQIYTITDIWALPSLIEVDNIRYHYCTTRFELVSTEIDWLAINKEFS